MILQLRADIEDVRGIESQLSHAGWKIGDRRARLNKEIEGAGIFTFLAQGIFVFFVISFVISAVVYLLHIPLSRDLSFGIPFGISGVLTLSNIMKVFELSQLKKRADSLGQQKSENYSKRVSLEEDLRKKELNYEQLKIDIDKITGELWIVKQSKI